MPAPAPDPWWQESSFLVVHADHHTEKPEESPAPLSWRGQHEIACIRLRALHTD